MAADKKIPADRTAFDWPRDTGTVDAVLAEMEAQVRKRKRVRRLGVAGASLLALVVIGLTLRQGAKPDSANGSDSAVVSGPNRRVLTDGTVVLLRDGAQLAEAFTPAIRRVTLTSGAAHFAVVRNANRPFVVEAGGAQVRAVGTAFTVDVTTQALQVLVTEGKVSVEKAVSSAGAEPQHLASLTAGERIALDLSRPLAPTAPVVEPNFNTQLSWQVPRLEFRRTPLAEVVRLVNTYSSTKLVIDGEALEQVRLSGTIRANNIEALLDVLQTDHGIRATHEGGDRIVLRPGR